MLSLNLYGTNYGGKATRAYTNRYDRMYYHIISTPASQLQVKTCHFELIANRPLTNANHFLSDHFGVWVDLSISNQEA